MRWVQGAFLLLHVGLLLSFTFGKAKSLFAAHWISKWTVWLSGLLLIVGHLFQSAPHSWWDDIGLKIGFVKLPQVSTVCARQAPGGTLQVLPGQPLP
jgi:hypothetical protein